MARNPMEAYRKSQKKKQQQRNKSDRKQAKQLKTVKRDTRELEAEVGRLEKAERSGTLDAQGKQDLADAKAELEHVQKTKKDYVSSHPEQGHLVFPNNRNKDKNDTSRGGDQEGGGLFTADGKLKNPERSIYYDPVFNPYGVPPPGQPLILKPEPEKPDESNDEDEDDDDIAMPDGPPPANSKDNGDSSSEEKEDDGEDDDGDDDDDDDIPLPSGPPPSKQAPINPPLPPGPPPVHQQFLGPFPHQYQHQQRQQRQHQNQPPRTHSPLPPPPAHLPSRPSSVVISQSQSQSHPQASTLITITTSSSPSLSTLTTPTSHVISAEPQLRNLHKEATLFVPTAVKRRQQHQKAPTTGTRPSVKVNATSTTPNDENSSDKQYESKTSLLDALSDVGVARESDKKRQKLSDDYC